MNTTQLMIAITVMGIALVAGKDVYYSIHHHLLDRPESVDESVIKEGKKLANSGRDAIPACTPCHGANGEGNFTAGFPRLAGLHKDYLSKQLQDFARDPLNTRALTDPIARDYTSTPRIYEDLTVYSPGTRKDPVMNTIAKQLTAAEIKALSTYYSSLSFKATPVAVDFQTLERGADIALRGKPEYRLPRCTACHGLEGEGFKQHFPPLAGQPASYIIKQLDKWQNGERDNDHLSLMKNVANLLTDADKINVAEYFSNKSYDTNKK